MGGPGDYYQQQYQNLLNQYPQTSPQPKLKAAPFGSTLNATNNSLAPPDQPQAPTSQAPTPYQPVQQQSLGGYNTGSAPANAPAATTFTPSQTSQLWAWDTPNGGDTRLTYIPNPNWSNDSWEGNYRHEQNYIPSIKEVVQRVIREQGVDVNDMQSVLNALSPYGIHATNPGAGLIDFGTGEGPIRLADWKTINNNGIDLEALNRAQDALPAVTDPAGGGGSSSSSIGGGSTNYGSGPAPYTPVEAPPNPYAEAMQAAILRLLQSPSTVDPQALAGSPEAAAYNLAAQRAEERDRASLAERAAAQGFSGSGGFETGLRGINQQRSEGEANFLGQLAVTRMQQQREDLKTGIQYALASSQFDQAQALQERLAQLDAAIRREQIAAQSQSNAADLAERGREYDLGLGFNYTQLQQQANQAALQQMLTGSLG